MKLRFPWLLQAALLTTALLLPTLLRADVAIPKLTRHVTDLTATLSAQQVDQLDARLVALQKAKGAQLVVLMVGTTKPQDIDGYSLDVSMTNKVGRKGIDDGVLLLVVKNDRQVRIEVGAGLEGAIPDAACARIIREYLAPKFRTGDYYGGISDAVNALTQLIDGEPLPPPVQGAPQEQRGPGFQGLFTVALFVWIFLRGVLGRTHAFVRAPLGGVVIGGLLWLLTSAGIGVLGGVLGGLLMLLPVGAGRSIGGGGWGGFGGWGGGGFGGGGGFSGGGGSFNGGGASGSW